MIDQEMISHLIKTFHLAITYLRIYPATSQLVTATIDTFYKGVQSVLEKNNTLTFSELSGKLLIDAKETDRKEIVPIANIILKLFTQRKIQSITFRSGLTKEELSDFITGILRKKRDELTQYPHIALDQTVYVAMVKGEEAVVKITEMVQNSGGEIIGLIKSLRESYDLIDQLPDANSRTQAQEHLAKQLAKQDTTVLREIFDRELPRKIEESGLKKRLLGALSQEKIQSIFGQISVWYDDIRKKESSDFAAVEQLEKLKYFMQAVLQAPASKDVPRQFFEELLRKGLLTQLPEWFAPAPERPATVYEAERLLEKEASELAGKEVLDTIPPIIEKLCQLDFNDLLGKLVEKLLENLNNPTAKIRLPAVQGIAKIYEILAAHSKENILRYMELPLLDAAKHETSPEINFFLTELLRLRARQNVLYGEYDFSLRILDVFRQLSSPDITNDAALRSNTEKSFNALVPEIISIVIADLKQDNEKKRLGSMQILSKIGEKAIDPLIRVIKESEDVRNRRLAALALKNLGNAARKRFGEELNLGLTGEEIKRVVEALGDFNSNEMVEQLSALVRYPDAGVKKEIMRFLAKLSTSQAKALLIEQLKDRDSGIVSEAVRLAGEIRLREAVPAMINILSSSFLPFTLQEEICISLGSIGDSRAIPALISKIKKKGSIFMRRNADIERIRMRAAWALGKFSGAEVESALEKASRDKTASISLTAKESLTSIKRKGKPS